MDTDVIEIETEQPVPRRPRVAWGAEVVDAVNQVEWNVVVDDEPVPVAAIVEAQPPTMRRRAQIDLPEDTPGGFIGFMQAAQQPPNIAKPEDVINIALRKQVSEMGHVLETLFAPYLGQVHQKKVVVNRCKLDRFMKLMGLNSNVLDPMKSVWKTGVYFVLAGGKLIDFVQNKMLNESENDYDVFPTDESMERNFLARMLGREFKATAYVGHLTEFISTTSNPYHTEDHPIKVQQVHCIHANPEEVVENFDIRACAIACDGQYIYWVKGALHDIRDKKIVMLNPRVHINTFNRIHKYIQKGYSIATPDLAIASVRFLDSIYRVNSESQTQQLLDRDFVYDRGTLGTAYVDFYGEQNDDL